MTEREKMMCLGAALRSFGSGEFVEALRISVTLESRQLMETFANATLCSKASAGEKTYAQQFATVTSDGRLKRNLEERR